MSEAHPEPTSFWTKYLFSVDHKVIAKQFMWAGFSFLLIGGILAMTIRWQWAFPGRSVPMLGSLFLSGSDGAVTPPVFNSLFTMHGLIMIFWAITPLMIGAFGNFVIPLAIGAHDMAFPKLNMLSFWTFLLSGVVVIAAFFTELGAASAGWTTYPPLSTNVGAPGWGQSLAVMALFLTGTATIMGGINYVVTVMRLRAKGMGYLKLPLSVWGLWLTAILNLLFVPFLAAGGLLLLLDRHFGTHFFVAGGKLAAGGDPILFQHLFWIFGHPEVYILILPVWGFIGDFVSFFARKPAHWYRGTVASMCAVTALSAVVYGHHMYVVGMAPMLGLSFEMLTLAISFPAVILFGNWLMTLWQGSIRTTVPMLFSLGTIFVFGLGGLTGLLLGTISTDVKLHDTLYVVGHFHFTMAASAFLGSFAAVYFWFPKMFGRQMSSTLGKIHFWGSVVFITLVFGGMLIAGYAGQQRRLFDPFQYEFLKRLAPLNRYTSYFAFALGATQIVFVINFFRSVFTGAKAEQNPWEIGTLEWTHAASPPVHHNYDEVPEVFHGPHEFADPVVREALHKDWLGQAEPYPDKKGGAEARD